MKQFEIYRADLRPVIESEQGGVRPVIILQFVVDGTDRILCAPITSKEFNNETHIMVNTQDGKIVYIMSEQIRNIDKKRLREKISELVEEDYQKVKNGILKLMK